MVNDPFTDKGAIRMMQSSLENTPRRLPYNSYMPPLSWGKVVARHAEDNTFDVALQNGSTFTHVQSCSPYLGSEVGLSYLPTHGLTNPVQTANGTWDIPTPSTKGDLYCVVAFLENSARQPKILGFFNPAQSEMTLSTLGAKLDRHESGVYHITLPTGHDEVHYPDGSYFVVGDTTSHDMTSENSAWNPPTQSSPMPIVFHHASGLSFEVQSNGDMTINIPASLNLSGSVSVGSGSHSVALADIIQSIFNSHTHTAPSGGGATSVPNTPMSGIGSVKLTTD